MAFADDLNARIVYRDRGLKKLTATGGLLRLSDKVLRKGALDVERRMKQRVVAVGFVDTGATLNSVQIKKDRSRQNHYSIGPRTHYAIYGEFGTRYMPARPFAVPALNDVRPGVLRALKRAIEGELLEDVGA